MWISWKSSGAAWETSAPAVGNSRRPMVARARIIHPSFPTAEGCMSGPSHTWYVLIGIDGPALRSIRAVSLGLSRILSNTGKDQEPKSKGRGPNVGAVCTERDSVCEHWIQAVMSPQCLAQMTRVPSREVLRVSKHMSCHRELLQHASLRDEDRCFSLLLYPGERTSEQNPKGQKKRTKERVGRVAEA
jgi:hypothetical protein